MILTYSHERFPDLIKAGIKIHTIRVDKNNRWKPGMTIQHWMHNPRNQSKNPHQFGTGVCRSIQKIKIMPDLKMIQIDGFTNARMFWKWFHEPFVGRLIHFTYYKYQIEQ